jgi:outer membrane protein assembly factor BamB
MVSLFRRRRIAAAVLVCMVMGVGGVSAVGVGEASVSVDWPAYLFNASHGSTTSSNAITASLVPSLIEGWHWNPPGPTAGEPNAQLWGSPTVVGNTIYIPSNTGNFYALDANSGAIIWSQFLGYTQQLTCGKGKGPVATATVATNPSTGKLTVYESGADGYLYAMDAATGNVVWKSVIALPSSTANDYYDWASPTLYNGRIYVGISSQCDSPLSQGGVREFDQATGNILATYHTVPDGFVGGSVWSSVAVDGSGVYVTTGNAQKGGYPAGTDQDAVSIVRLNVTTLAREDKWMVPLAHPGSDQDFGASATLFTATLNGTPTAMVGAMNKNGIFYAWQASNLAAGPVWQYQIDNPVTPSVPAAVWDGSHLYIAGNQTTIGGTTYNGAIRELDPATGAVIWETGLESSVLGTPGLNGSGILAVPTYASINGAPISHAPNGTYLVDQTTGNILGYISEADDYEWAQPVWVGKELLLATANKGLFAYVPSTVTHTDGFEAGTLTGWNGIRGVQIESSDVDSGSYAAEAIANNTPATASTTLSQGLSDLTVSIRFKIVSRSTSESLLSLKDTNGKSLMSVSVSSTGKLTTRNTLASKTTASPTTVSSGVWHTLTVHLIDSATGQSSVRLDGVVVPKLSTAGAFSGTPAQIILIGDGASNRIFDTLYDNLEIRVPS